MTTTLLRLAPLVLLLTGLSAQVSQVKNTGCPNAAYPSMTAPKINQNTTITFPSLPSTHFAFTIMGFSSGNPLIFNRPFTCVDKCGLYPALPAFFIVQHAPGTKSWTLKVPNDKTLWQRCFSVQTASADPKVGCINLHGALSFCIGR